MDSSQKRTKQGDNNYYCNKYSWIEMDALPLRTSNDVHHAKQEQMKHKTWKYMQQTYNIDEKAKAHIFGLLLAQTSGVQRYFLNVSR